MPQQMYLIERHLNFYGKRSAMINGQLINARKLF